MPYSSVLERASGTHKYSVQQELSLLTSTCSVVCLLPQAYSNKLRLAALEVPGFIFLWCLGAQRKGMVINMAKRHYIPVTADVPGVSDGQRAFLRRAIRTALAAEGVDFPCEVDVRLTNDETIHQINLDMREVDRPTDVLSFPAFDLTPGELPGPEDADPGTGLVPLGDMVISMERVAAQAKEYGHSNRRELAYLTVHSVLHLLGYDHLDEGPQKAQMRAREEAIMAELGLER